MSLYTLLNLLILAAPLLLSFDRRVAFYKKVPALLCALAVVSAAYIVWDILVTARGDWWFSPRYAGDVRIAGLPIGELLFFITVPFSCLFLYEVVRGYFPRRVIFKQRSLFLVLWSIVGLCITFALVFRKQGYTFLSLLSVAAFLITVMIADRNLLKENHPWLFFLLSFITFAVANGVLTALPIVLYNPESIWGIRIYTIPLEDFFYNFGMLGFYLVVFRKFKQIMPKSWHSTERQQKLAEG